ncbi:MAG: ferrochelatase, partial [Pyrinomonadaceae bacterium]
QPWLGPDVCDYLRELKSAGAMEVVISPIGFISDHMEIIYDLNIEARGVCETLGLNMVRASTAGTNPAFVKMVRELILERVEGTEPRFLGTRGPGHDVCPADCCLIDSPRSGRHISSPQR